jgi:hypothetical protein
MMMMATATTTESAAAEAERPSPRLREVVLRVSAGIGVDCSRVKSRWRGTDGSLWISNVAANWSLLVALSRHPGITVVVLRADDVARVGLCSACHSDVAARTRSLPPPLFCGGSGCAANSGF